MSIVAVIRTIVYITIWRVWVGAWANNCKHQTSSGISWVTNGFALPASIVALSRSYLKSVAFLFLLYPPMSTFLPWKKRKELSFFCMCHICRRLMREENEAKGRVFSLLLSPLLSFSPSSLSIYTLQTRWNEDVISVLSISVVLGPFPKAKEN